MPDMQLSDQSTSPSSPDLPPLGELTELEDGSAIVELDSDPVDSSDETDFSANLAESLSEFELNTIATNLLELIEKDKKAREERDKQQEEGIRRTGLGNNAPGGAEFEGSSKVVHPVLAEGCVDFSARAIKEIFPSNGPVRTKIFGTSDEPKLEKARKKRDFLNFYLVEKMPEYRSEKEVLLTQLPLGGSQYEKYWFDGRRVRMEFVPVDKVFLPFSANSFYTASRITHERTLTEDKVEEHVDSGFYRDVFTISEHQVETTASEDATAKIEGKEDSGYNEDGQRIIYEVTCTWDINEEGSAPYVIHIDKSTGKIAAIYRNWKESDESKERLDWWVEDKFIPWRGAYGIGFPHLIGGLSGALTGALRALLDSAHINNAPTAIKLKGGRTSGQNITVDMTAVTEVEAPAGVDDIRKIMMPMPFNPPSAVLFQLLDWITAQAKGVVATAEEKIADAGNNMPVGTALALIEQGSQVFSSIHARLHDAQRRALKIICRLIADYPEHAMADLARFGLVPQDFLASDDVEPISDPNIFSETQRFAQMQSVMQLASGDAQDPTIPWNKIAIRRRMLEMLRVDGIDEFLPKPIQPVTADPVSENVAACRGSMLKAMEPQDHLSHIKTHVMFILSPLGAIGAIPPQGLAGLMGHINEHIVMAYEHVARMAEFMLKLEVKSGEINPDQMALEAAMKAQDSIAKTLEGLLPMIQQAQQVVQKAQPQPPIDPAIQKTFEAAMAEINRKTEVDKAENARKDSQAKFEQDQKTQETQLQPILESIQREFDAKLEVERMQREDERNKFNQWVELQKNEQDNQQHQMTELIKNFQDNQTAMQNKLVEVQNQVKETGEKVGSTPQPNAPDFGPMMKEMSSMLAQIEKAKTNDALQATIEGMRALIGSLNAPTELVFGQDGKPVGSRKVLPQQ